MQPETSPFVFGIPDSLPEHPGITPNIPHAPKRNPNLSPAECKLAVENALRYFPPQWHQTLAPEFAAELKEDGHIYARRFRPTYKMYARPIKEYPARCQQAAALMHMIQNNLDPSVAQYPEELITYGGNGSVFSNWAQYLIVMKYLSELRDDQTLVMYSGHPMGVFPSHRDAPRVVVTNGLMIPNYSSKPTYDKLYALGVTQYGQMTAGSYCYIGPQGIVHGTTITLLSAARKYLRLPNMSGRVYLSSGLGGMSGAQPKAGLITGGIAVIAEINPKALLKRHEQGWVCEVVHTVADCEAAIRSAKRQNRATSIAYRGNVVDLWEHFAALASKGDNLIDLASDQTSLHNPYAGGYYPAGLSFDESNALMTADPAAFKDAVSASLKRQVAAINTCAAKGTHFWDYGNAFLLEASRAGADILDARTGRFKYPSYCEEFMGDIFSLGFGPFRWVCTSGLPSDLEETDRIAAEVFEHELDEMRQARHLNPEYRQRMTTQLQDNLAWIKAAQGHKLVVGSQARILYSDERGRSTLALAFNEAVRTGRITAPVVLSRDHHDVSGADSPYRETSNIRDGSQLTADMAVHTCLGNGFRGATWVALHNGGGVGWGEVINCGFGLVLDGTPEADRRAREMLCWDVNNGIARRAWARNENAEWAISRAMEREPRLRVTVGQHVDPDLLNGLRFD